jgi:hypothetical protein
MTDQSRPDPTPVQGDHPEQISFHTPTYRPQSSSSRPSNPRPRRPYRHGNSSSTSIDSTTLLDHRTQPHSLSRNMSIPHATSHSHGRRISHYPRRPRPDGQYSSDETSDHDQDQEQEDDETMHLMASTASRQSFAPWTKPRRTSLDESTRLMGSSERLDIYGSSSRSERNNSPSRLGRRSSPTRMKRYSHINHPSSVPSSIGSPPLRSRNFSVTGQNAQGEQISMPLAQRAQRRLTQYNVPSRLQGDVLIDIDPLEHVETDLSALPPPISSPHTSTHSSSASVHSRRKTYKAEEDVCFPTEAPSPKASWPDYEVLEEWAAQEGKSLDEGSAAVRDGDGGFLSREGHRKVSEPVMVDGRYRRAYTFPSSIPYEVHPPLSERLMKTDETRPYRFTFFTDKLATTVHSPTISELVDEGEHFSHLFEGEGCECWWLDVSGISDEEMRTLSRVPPLHPVLIIGI